MGLVLRSPSASSCTAFLQSSCAKLLRRAVSAEIFYGSVGNDAVRHSWKLPSRRGLNHFANRVYQSVSVRISIICEENCHKPSSVDNTKCFGFVRVNVRYKHRCREVSMTWNLGTGPWSNTCKQTSLLLFFIKSTSTRRHFEALHQYQQTCLDGDLKMSDSLKALLSVARACHPDARL